MLKAIGYKAVDILFPFIAGRIERAPEYNENSFLTTFHTAYSAVLNVSLLEASKLMLNNTRVSEIESSIAILKTTSKTMFGCLVDKNLFILKFHSSITLLRMRYRLETIIYRCITI